MGVTEKSKPVLSNEEREKFDRDGYLVIDPGCSERVLDAIVADLDGLYEGGGSSSGRIEGGVHYFSYSIMDAWRINENVKSVALAPRVLAILTELFGRKPLPFQTINFPSGSQQAIHSDAIHFNSRPPRYMCGVWVALEDIDMENGPLVYYPGSQKLPEVTMQDVGVASSKEEYPKYERYIAELIEGEGLQPEYATLDKGQALIWSSNILHGGLIQRDRSRTRHSQVTHCFFEGCQYYTPLLSEGDNLHLRNPQWIE